MHGSIRCQCYASLGLMEGEHNGRKAPSLSATFLNDGTVTFVGTVDLTPQLTNSH